MFILRDIIEQVNEWQATLRVSFLDFEKDFDSIHRENLWVVMWKYVILEKMVKLFCEDFHCAVEDQGETGESFGIKTGVKQVCSMPSFLFLLVMV